jgi:glycosyltransferase involved in cell wall biosynthesis
MTDPLRRPSQDNRFGVYLPSSRVGVGAKMFGKDVANFELFQALVRHGGFDRVDFLTQQPVEAEALREGLRIADDCPTEVGSADVLTPDLARAAGTVLRGTPRLEELAWLRRTTSGDAGYSLVGLIHTIAPPAMREEIAMASVAPVQPWDALICTSPSVQSGMGRMFDDWDDYLAERFGGARRTRPLLPLIPLGVDGEALRKRADAGRGAALRSKLGMATDDVLVIWIGRLSYFEKAFPQPMMRAVAEAGRRAGRRVHFAMAGWFPNAEGDERMYRQAAVAHGPDLAFHLLDGNDRDQVDALRAGADIFLSLVDNIQETFGITPLEAMASGLPVVVSDWDGYRHTVEDGVQGFRVPTLIGPAGALPASFTAGHDFRQRSYQQYVGILAQHTAVDVEAATQTLTRLIESPELRRTLGEAGRERVRTVFDWSVVAPQYRALADELAAIRRAAGATPRPGGIHPVRGEPLADFAHFATRVLTDDTVLTLRPGAGRADLERASRVQLDAFASRWRATPEECGLALDQLAAGPATAGDLLQRVPAGRRGLLRLGLVWMVKLGLLTWR